MSFIEYTYTFNFYCGPKKHFNIKLNLEEMSLAEPPSADKKYPDWTLMGSFQCPNCPFDKKTIRYCPVACSISGLVSEFRNYVSYERVDVDVETPLRKISKETSLQEGLSSLIGIYMVSSGCPHFERLKPMLRFHTPFSSDYETAYRALSMYLLGEYFMKKNGVKKDISLSGLSNMYHEIRVVNKNIINRFNTLKQKDATINALINLDCFATNVALSIDNTMFDDLEILYKSYYKNPKIKKSED
ncbi:MAG: hypothetical protein R6W70_11495 [bacterium]